MLLTAVEDRDMGPRVAADRVYLRCDDKGCTLFGGAAERSFPDVQTALASARRSRELDSATIEIWQRGQYICCMAPRAWHRQDAAFPDISGPPLLPGAVIARAERYANRVGQVLLATAGPLFWLALVAAVVAGSLGWRFLLF